MSSMPSLTRVHTCGHVREISSLFVVSGMQLYCVALYVDHILHRDRFWAISIASGSVRLWDLRFFWMVLSHVIRGVLVISSPLEG